MDMNRPQGETLKVLRAFRPVFFEGARTGSPDGRVDPAVEERLSHPWAGRSCGCQRFFRRAEGFACFLDEVTFAFGTITLWIGITVGCPGSSPSC